MGARRAGRVGDAAQRQRAARCVRGGGAALRCGARARRDRAGGRRGANFKAAKRKRDFEDAGANCLAFPLIVHRCSLALRAQRF